MKYNTQKRILVIDDDDAILEVIQTVLESEGYIVTTASRGSYVFTLKDDLPDLILLDVLLSGEDSMAICIRLKKQEHTKHIPIIMLSAHSNIEHTAKSAGADNYLPKPFDIDVLIAVVRKHINK